MSSSAALREIFTLGRPLVEQALDAAEQIAALRDAATAKGLDWSQLKALLKAQIQDERDEAGDGKRVKRIVEKAEFASAYADMLGLANMNENFNSAAADVDREWLNASFERQVVNPETGEVHDNDRPETRFGIFCDRRAAGNPDGPIPGGQADPVEIEEVEPEDSGNELPETGSELPETANEPQPVASYQHAEAAIGVGLAGPACAHDDVPANIKPAPNPLKPKTAADYRPNCLHPEACASSYLGHCYGCKKAIGEPARQVA